MINVKNDASNGKSNILANLETRRRIMGKKSINPNPHIYHQYDERWAKLPYPDGKYTMASSGCGCCSVTHCAIEQPEYWSLTPEDVQPYMKQFATHGWGTTRTGITKGLLHYGYECVYTPSIKKLSSVWKRLKEGHNVGILLFTKGERNGVSFTSGGHYIAFYDYKKENGKHWFRLKDSNYRHNDGWFCFETHMKGLLTHIFIADRNPNYKLKVDGYWGAHTTIALQHYFGVKENGIIANQPTSTKPHHHTYGMDTTFRYVEYKDRGDGSAVIRELDKFLNEKLHKSLPVDGILGSSSIRALQKFLGVKETGVLNKKTVKKLQQFLNKSVDI